VALDDPLHWGAITGLALVLYAGVALVSWIGARLALPGGGRA
jgi:hypothetical protein